jgi:BirA family transcriptional regulator, biotin operon repressor / biotin---[acetyl-CoA-carboxylase] ligase
VGPRTVSIVTSVWNDLNRPPLRGVDLIRDLEPEGWRLDLRDEVESTQTELLAAARAGEPEGVVVIAEYQGAGRGRRDRTWVSPPRAGITMSMLFRPPTISPWVGIAVAVGAAQALREFADTPCQLKWPNDLLVAGRKIGGIIAEVESDAIVVGLGINVTTTASELPIEGATSLAIEGALTDRATLIKSILRAVRTSYRWEPAILRRHYLELLETIGRQVRVEGIDQTFEGLAEGIDAEGHLVVDGRSISVGDVIHLR